ncbi:hypothetical protein J8N05_34570 [Streptomyces sp. BH-SS-21]|uniref:Uncharacterized protein n=1 Tax=Streptomyces liliiviolaceus TaxID=2823109 RepID=A0A940XYP7_9ACTN|nr:hypothetical protein [Streptomyces liliiviolaceus]MBQ0853292.1 hypothetical protein [Streptomyces liliiviolaceus]
MRRQGARALTALLLVLLVGVAGPRPAAADDGTRPPGAADGTNLSKDEAFDNPLLSPPLMPVEQLRFLLRRLLPDHQKQQAFNQSRNGAVDFLNPLLLTEKQLNDLLGNPRYASFESRRAWRASMIDLKPMKRFLDPRLVEQLEEKGYNEIPGIAALSGERLHSEGWLQKLEDEAGIAPEAKIASASERQQCAKCSRFYLRQTRTLFAYPYDLTVKETAQKAEDMAKLAKDWAAEGKSDADRKAKLKVEKAYGKERQYRNGVAQEQLGVDLDGVMETAKKENWEESAFKPPFALPSGPSCALPDTRSQRRPVPSALVLAAAKADGTCDEGRGGGAADADAATGLGATLAVPGGNNGGIDFSTMELRYLADPGDGSGLRYSFGADRDPLKGDNRTSTGVSAAARTSDAFFVWLSLDPSAFWVNLNPTEPERVVDDELGRTDVGRIMLEADLRMKKTVGELIHPHTALGRRYWDGLRGECASTRNWITSAPASVHEDGDELYILDAPLDVQMESQYLSEAGGTGDAPPSCPRPDRASEEHNEDLYRTLVLPELTKAVNTAPEYADLRRVHLARVAAQWYRERARTQDTTYGDLIDSGDIAHWRTTARWKPRDTFDRYVDSYRRGEFDVTEKLADGGAKNYVFGGVDFSRVSLRQVPDTRFEADFAKLPKGVDRSLRTPSMDADTVWLGAPTPREASGLGPPDTSAGAGTWALRLLPLLLLPAAFLLLRRRRRHLNTSSSTSPLRRAAVEAPRRRRTGLSDKP